MWDVAARVGPLRKRGEKTMEERARIIEAIVAKAIGLDLDAVRALLDREGIADPALRIEIERRVLSAVVPTNPGEASATASDAAIAREFLDAALADEPRPVRRVSPTVQFDTTPPATLAGFEIREIIGKGGMGSVYSAFDPKLHRDVAIKLLPSGASEKEIRRFEDEARAAARLSHPAIVKILSVAADQGRHFIVMERIHGNSLAQEIQWSLSPTSAPTATRLLPTFDHADYISTVTMLVAQAAEGLHAAHSAAIVHRDIKPSNLLIDSQTGSIHIVDFGVARDMRFSRRTVTGNVLGTPQYMSPEQIRGDRTVGSSSDTYSLGVVLYELLTLRLPFANDDIVQLCDSIVNRTPVPVQELNPRVPRDLAIICAKAMAKQPSDRYPDTASLGADLRRFVRHEAIHAEPLSVATRAWRLARRHPMRVAMALVVAALVGLMMRDAVARMRRVEDLMDRIHALQAKSDWGAADLQEVNLLIPRAKAVDLSTDDAIVASEFLRHASRLHDVAMHDARESLVRAADMTECDESRAWHQVHGIGALKDAQLLDPSDGEAASLIQQGYATTALEVRSVDTNGQQVSANLLIARVECSSGLAREFQPMGVGSVMRSDFAPGFYRIRAEFPSGEHQEVDVVIGIGAMSQRIEVRQRPRSERVVDMVLIRGRTITFPSEGGCCLGGTTIAISSFWIDCFEVSNAEYRRFTQSTGHPEPHYWRLGYAPEMDSKPVTGITVDDAAAYAHWSGKRLPAHAEWEFAARGDRWLQKPWAQDGPGLPACYLCGEAPSHFDASEWQCYARCAGDVRAMPEGASSDGIHHLLGNAAEYCSGPFVDTLGGAPVVHSRLRPVFGGSFLNKPEELTLERHGFVGANPADHQVDVGFRCVMSD